jgi:hypothetical protein
MYSFAGKSRQVKTLRAQEAKSMLKLGFQGGIALDFSVLRRKMLESGRVYAPGPELPG